MRLLVGLGNPGKGYANNRHNIGFMAVDAIAARHGLSDWRVKFQAHVAEGTVGGEKVLALKPMTFMNESGRAVGEALRFYKLTAADVIVMYDEMELAPGKTRVKQGGGSAGHNGIKSLDSHIGADFWRVRLGVGHPGEKSKATGYVLQDFSKADQPWVKALIEAVADRVPLLIADDANRFMTDVALAMRDVSLPEPPRQGEERA